MPSLGNVDRHALAAAEQALIPVQANYLSREGAVEQLLNTINKVAGRSIQKLTDRRDPADNGRFQDK